MIKNASLLLTVLVLSVGCSKLRYDWTMDGYSGRYFSKVAVIGITQNAADQRVFEAKAVELFERHGVKAVEGMDIFPPEMSEDDLAPDELMKRVKAHNLDAIITISFSASTESAAIIPEEQHKFSLFYRSQYRHVHSPGYLAPTKTYSIEASLYDFVGGPYKDNQTCVWWGRSTILDYGSLESTAEVFTQKMVSHIMRKGIIKEQELEVARLIPARAKAE